MVSYQHLLDESMRRDYQSVKEDGNQEENREDTGASWTVIRFLLSPLMLLILFLDVLTEGRIKKIVTKKVRTMNHNNI